jgi:hypothetical protein
VGVARLTLQRDDTPCMNGLALTEQIAKLFTSRLPVIDQIRTCQLSLLCVLLVKPLKSSALWCCGVMNDDIDHLIL